MAASQNKSNMFGVANHKDSRKRTKSVQIGGNVSAPKINYSELVSIINEFMLEEHEKFLGKFLNLFREIDSDQDGVISNEEFLDLYTRMNLKISNISTDQAALDEAFKQNL